MEPIILQTIIQKNNFVNFVCNANMFVPAKFSIWFKIGICLYCFFFFFIFLAGLSHYPWPVWITFSLESILFV